MSTDKEWLDIIHDIMSLNGRASSLLYAKTMTDHGYTGKGGDRQYLYKEFVNVDCFNAKGCGCGECVLYTLEELE